MKRTMKLFFGTLTSALFAICFSANVFAEGETTQKAGALESFLPLIMIALLGVMFYFFMYRPQKKQEKEVKAMRDNLTVGDEVVTNAGIIGRVVRIKEDIVTLELGSDRTKMKIFNWAIREVILPANASDDEAPKKVEEQK